MGERALLVFTKPAHPGRVKTRLIGVLSARQAAELHAAFLADLLERLADAKVPLRIAWALEAGEDPPSCDFDATRQEGVDLGARMFKALADAAADASVVGVVGSDLPELMPGDIEEAFASVESGRADIALGPADDGGYYLLVVRREALDTELFNDIPWSSKDVLDQTLERCDRLGLRWHLLRRASDVDSPADLETLSRQITAIEISSPRAASLLRSWGRVEAGEE